ncbi:MAG TPA: four helix bundle protein [Candidatus Kapabacteria bacterium]|nr:four helix bundle protein [Candidatus Kapabacteria bacterium]
MPQEPQTYESLDVWKFSMELVQEIYDLTKSFPDIEQQVLQKEIRTAAIKIPAKIAAGYSCGISSMMHRYYCYSIAHLSTLETHIQLSERFGYIPKVEAKPVFEKCKRIGKLIEKLIFHEEEGE